MPLETTCQSDKWDYYNSYYFFVVIMNEFRRLFIWDVITVIRTTIIIMFPSDDGNDNLPVLTSVSVTLKCKDKDKMYCWIK